MGGIRRRAETAGSNYLKRPMHIGKLSVRLSTGSFIVENLVINALEAIPRGGVLTLSASARGGEIQVEVSDTGPGIPPEIQGELFKPYFSTKCRGTGMGLALTEKLRSCGSERKPTPDMLRPGEVNENVVSLVT